MENTLSKSFENTNDNQTDFIVEIADNETNIDFFRDYNEDDKDGYIAYLENKGFVEVLPSAIIEGSEYSVGTRPKRRPRT